jgi:hypothetical protein
MPNVMISDLLEPHALRLIAAILQPRLLPPLIPAIRYQHPSNKPFKFSSVQNFPPPLSRFGTKPVPQPQFGTKLSPFDTLRGLIQRLTIL